MKCAICNQKTNYDVSYGTDSFIVCPTCFKRIKRMTVKSSVDILVFILAIGKIKKDKDN